MSDTAAANATPTAAEPPVPPTAAAAAPSGEHKLETPWTFWFDKKQSRAAGAPRVSYRDNLKELSTFDTVEGFWSHYVHLKRPSQLPPNCNVYMFRETLVPMWETFPRGGCWILKVRKSSGVLSKVWQDLLLALIGEMFKEPSVVGAALAVRGSADMISIWNSDNSNDQIRFLIGDRIREILGLELHTLMEYKFHQRAMQDKSTYTNTEAFVFTTVDNRGKGRVAAGKGKGKSGTTTHIRQTNKSTEDKWGDRVQKDEFDAVDDPDAQTAGVEGEEAL